MEKTLRLLGLAAIVGAFAIVAAQQFSPAQRGQSRPSSGSSGTVASGRSKPYSNSVLSLLAQYFCAKQEVEMERAKLAGQQDRVQPIIKANNTALLMLQTPEQQARTIAEWQIEIYAPNDKGWAAVARTRTMAKTLLNISKELEDQGEVAMESAWGPMMKETRSFDKKLAQTAAFKNAKTVQEKQVIHYNAWQEYLKAHPRPPMIEIRQRNLALFENALASLRPHLSPAQQKEFDTLKSSGLALIKAAATANGSLSN